MNINECKVLFFFSTRFSQTVLHRTIQVFKIYLLLLVSAFFFFNYTRFIVLVVSFLSSYKVIRFIPSFVCSSFAQTWIILIFEKFRFNRYLSNIDLRIEQGGSFSLEFHFCANISSSFFDWLLKLIFHRIILSISFLYIYRNFIFLHILFCIFIYSSFLYLLRMSISRVTLNNTQKLTISKIIDHQRYHKIFLLFDCNTRSMSFHLFSLFHLASIYTRFLS